MKNGALDVVVTRARGPLQSFEHDLGARVVLQRVAEDASRVFVADHAQVGLARADLQRYSAKVIHTLSVLAEYSPYGSHTLKPDFS